MAIPGTLALLVVVGFVALAGWNRSAAPVRLTLTERELWHSSRPGAPREAPRVEVSVITQRRDAPLDARNWLTVDRLRALGFTLHVRAGAPEALEHYQRELPRMVWVVFEYDGDAYRDIERSRQLMLGSAAPGDAIAPPRHPAGWDDAYRGSRLVPVDAGLDFNVLAARYPEGHLILRANVMLQVRHEGGGPVVYGVVRDLISTRLTVPRHVRHVIEDLPPASPPWEPRYEVDVAVGRLGIPYITDIRRFGGH